MGYSHGLDREYALYVYNQGYTDEQIADRLGSNVRAVERWRKFMGLEKNERSRENLSKLERDAIAARKAGLTYGQYKAREEGKKRGRKSV